MYRMILVFILTICGMAVANLSFGQDVYQKGSYQLIRSNPDVPLVSSFDARALAVRFVPDYSLQSAHCNPHYYEGISYEFCRKSDSKIFFITVGLYPTVSEAETAVLDHLNRTPAGMVAWKSTWEKVGDNAWYSEISLPRTGTSYIDLIFFIRKNAVITLNIGDNFNFDLRAIASAIDRDILSGADYLKVEDKISPPVITSASLTKSVLREGETAYLTFQASDPSGSLLGSWASYDETNHTWRNNVLADRTYFRSLYPGETFEGQHILSCWVVNTNNLFSSIKELTVTF